VPDTSFHIRSHSKSLGQFTPVSPPRVFCRFALTGLDGSAYSRVSDPCAHPLRAHHYTHPWAIHSTHRRALAGSRAGAFLNLLMWIP
jgi:hypothetical protein